MGTGHGSLGADVVEQTAGHLRFLGRVSALVPEAPTQSACRARKAPAEPYIPLVGDELPSRHKGMHRRTYEKIIKRYEAYKTITDQDLIAALARMMR